MTFTLRELLDIFEVKDLGALWSGKHGIHVVGNLPQDGGGTCPVINMGLMSFDDTESTQHKPAGYELSGVGDGYEMEEERVRTFPLVIKNDFQVCCLKRVLVLPTFPESITPRIELRMDDQLLSGSVDLSINQDDSACLSVRCAFKLSDTQRDDAGYIARWILLIFERTEHFSKIDRRTHEFVIGVRVVGGLAKDVVSQSLSVEARPFVPASLFHLFDTNVQVFYPERLSVRVPPRFRKALAQTVSHFPPARLVSSYTEKWRAQALHEMRDVVSVLQSSPLLEVNTGAEGIASVFTGFKSNQSCMCVTLPVQYLLLQRQILWLEEAHMAADIVSYDCHFHRLKFDCRDEIFFVQFQVRGASENRPRICIGDYIKIRPATAQPWFEMVAVVMSFSLSTEVVVAQIAEPFQIPFNVSLPPGTHHFDSTALFEALEELEFHVRFTFQRAGFNFALVAIETVLRVDQLRERLFPPQLRPNDASNTPDSYRFREYINSYTHCPIKESEIEWINKTLNREQRWAVRRIISMRNDVLNGTTNGLPLHVESEQYPFIVYGPPGTGKTVTLIEAILQILKRKPNARILAVAPSDAAADVICLRLSDHLSPELLHRLSWWQRIVSSIPARLLRYSTIPDLVDMPKKRELQEKRVIVSTCGATGAMSALEWIAFDYIFVDEASQALESEVLVPLTLANAQSSFVLAGDPRQLGASVHSPLLMHTQATMSLQERLMLHPLWGVTVGYGYNDSHDDETSDDDIHEDDEAFKSPRLCFLVNNYRCHEQIMSVPSRMFYAGALRAAGDVSLTHSLCNWHRLPQPARVESDSSTGFPVLFRGCFGNQEHDMDSPSYYNSDEAQAVLEVIQDLASASEITVGTNDIGVIAAFRSQVLKIRKLLRSNDFGGINVGQVEDFQGQECRVIIISTVLTSRLRSVQSTGSLGLMEDARRFNVSVTRAMSLLVVVGHPYLLYTDTYWRELIDFCLQHGAYWGPKCSLFPDAPAAVGVGVDVDVNVDVADHPVHINPPALLNYASASRRMSGVTCDEDEELLNTAAKITLLEAGVVDVQSDELAEYYRQDIVWRNLL